MKQQEVEKILDEIRAQLPVADEVDKLVEEHNIKEPFTASFKLGVIAVTMRVLKKYEEIYINLVEEN